MTAPKAGWIREIPEIGDRYLNQADRLEEEKAEFREKLAGLLRAEADLWTELARSKNWTRKEMAAALLKMDPEVLPFLPEKF